jgi:ribose transport system substrate-binding protein
MTDIRVNRRDMVRATVGLASASLLGLLNVSPALTAEMGKVAGQSEKPLKAAFSNIGLQVGWCSQGKRAAEYWGKLFNVDVTWFDGELSDAKQRTAIEDMANQKCHPTVQHRHVDVTDREDDQ